MDSKEFHERADDIQQKLDEIGFHVTKQYPNTYCMVILVDAKVGDAALGNYGLSNDNAIRVIKAMLTQLLEVENRRSYTRH